MRQIIKTAINIILTFIAGFIVGAVIALLWSARSTQFIMDSVALNYIAYEADEATNSYIHSQNIDVSIYALEHFVKYEEYIINNKKDNVEIPKSIYHDLVVSYVRLGKLYERKGNNQKINYHYKKAFEIVSKHKMYDKWRGTEKEIKSIDDLIKLISEIDNKIIADKTKNNTPH